MILLCKLTNPVLTLFWAEGNKFALFYFFVITPQTALKLRALQFCFKLPADFVQNFFLYILFKLYITLVMAWA